MFSPRQRASFIVSKMVSIVASACFRVTPRFETRMLIKSDLSIPLPNLPILLGFFQQHPKMSPVGVPGLLLVLHFERLGRSLRFTREGRTRAGWVGLLVRCVRRSPIN